MRPPRQIAVCILYALVARAALVCTWAQALPYLSQRVLGGSLRFWVDILFVFAVAWRWMLTEARRLKMSGSHWYLLGSLLLH